MSDAGPMDGGVDARPSVLEQRVAALEGPALVLLTAAADVAGQLR